MTTKDELLAARNAAQGAVWSVLYCGLPLNGVAHEMGDPEESDWRYDEFGIEVEKAFRRLFKLRDELQDLLTDRLLTAVEEAKARAGDPMPVSVGNRQYPTYHRAALERLRQFTMMLFVGRPYECPSWVYELRRERPHLAATGPQRHAYYKSLHGGLMTFGMGAEVEEMETGIRCECAHAMAAAPDAESVAAVDEPEDFRLALTATQTAVIATMAQFEPSQLLSTARIGEAMPPADRRSDETIRKTVVELIEPNITERPDGPRSGVRLTMTGRRLVGKIAD